MCYHGRGGFFFSSFSSCLSLSTSFYFKCINRDPLGGHGAGGADGMGEGVMVSFFFMFHRLQDYQIIFSELFDEPIVDHKNRAFFYQTFLSFDK